MRKWVSVGLACLGLVGCLIGWIGAVFGPSQLFVWGVVGLACGLVGSLMSRRPADRSSAFLPPWVFWWATGAKLVAGVLVFGCLVAMLGSSGCDGVAGSPALEVRSTYQLNNHGHHTTVSRGRYIVASGSFSTGLLALAVLVNLDVVTTLARAKGQPHRNMRRPTRSSS